MNLSIYLTCLLNQKQARFLNVSAVQLFILYQFGCLLLPSFLTGFYLHFIVFYMNFLLDLTTLPVNFSSQTSTSSTFDTTAEALNRVTSESNQSKHCFLGIFFHVYTWTFEADFLGSTLTHTEFVYPKIHL